MAAADGLRTVTTLEPGASHAPRLKVFVSYSRTDTTFADELVAGLDYDGGFEVFIDRHSIHEGEAWRERLSGLIASADIIVFLLSKASAKSELCRWEAEHAQGLSKRLVPVLIEAIDGEAAPTTLKALHYVRFDEGKSFMQGLAALRRALRADFAWVQEHTRLLMRAQEWNAAGRAENRLLSGPDITAAKAWLEQHPVDAPSPLELHRDYIAASDRAEIARLSKDREQAEELKNALARSKRALTWTIIVGAVAVVAGVAAGVFAFQNYEIGLGAEQAVAERDTYIKKAEARDAEQTTLITELRANIETLSAVAYKDERELAALERDIADTKSMIDELLMRRPGAKPSLRVSQRPAREPTESTEAYMARLQEYRTFLAQEFTRIDAAAARAPSVAPYRPRIMPSGK